MIKHMIRHLLLARKGQIKEMGNIAIWILIFFIVVFVIIAMIMMLWGGSDLGPDTASEIANG